MTKRTRRFYGVLGALIFCMVIIGVWNRTKFYGTKDLNQWIDKERFFKSKVQLDSSFVPDEAKVYLHKKVWEEKGLQEGATVIAKVKVDPSKERTIQYTQDCIKTNLKVEEVYKGEVEKGSDLVVYEYASCVCGDKKMTDIYSSQDGYQIMQGNEEYYVFLQKIPAKEGIKGKDEYLFFNAAYSKIPVRPKSVEVLSKDREYTYEEVRDLEILTTDPKVEEQYKKLSEQVRKDYS